MLGTAATAFETFGQNFPTNGRRTCSGEKTGIWVEIMESLPTKLKIKMCLTNSRLAQKIKDQAAPKKSLV